MIYSYCYGGFSNRFYSLVNSYGLSKLLNTKIKIYWSQTNWSYSNFLNIFDVFDDSIEFTFLDPKEALEECDVIFSHINHDIKNKFIITQHSDLNLLNKKNKIYYSHHYKDNNLFNLAVFFKNFNFKKNIINYVNEFSEKYFDETTEGIHVRTTDITDNNFWYSIISNLINTKSNKFFICSDLNEVELFYKNTFLDRIILNVKDSEVSKIDESKDWCYYSPELSPIYNVFRSEQQTIDGIIDLLLLSKLNTKYGLELSTFYQLSKELTNYNKEIK